MGQCANYTVSLGLLTEFPEDPLYKGVQNFVRAVVRRLHENVLENDDRCSVYAADAAQTEHQIYTIRIHPVRILN